MNTESQEQVKRYLAYWFQLGKGVIFPKGQETLRPQPIFEGNRYSAEFEQCWQKILSTDTSCYLEGTEQTIQQLLSPAWEIVGCPRCELPVPMTVAGVAAPVCTCFDLSNWPNSDLPSPRFPVDTTQHLQGLHKKLNHQDDVN